MRNSFIAVSLQISVRAQWQQQLHLQRTRRGAEAASVTGSSPAATAMLGSWGFVTSAGRA